MHLILLVTLMLISSKHGHTDISQLHAADVQYDENLNERGVGNRDLGT